MTKILCLKPLQLERCDSHGVRASCVSTPAVIFSLQTGKSFITWQPLTAVKVPILLFAVWQFQHHKMVSSKLKVQSLVLRMAFYRGLKTCELLGAKSRCHRLNGPILGFHANSDSTGSVLFCLTVKTLWNTNGFCTWTSSPLKKNIIWTKAWIFSGSMLVFGE